jgi:protein-tyrosine-phosphatase
MAEAMLRHRLDERGLGDTVRTHSAGLLSGGQLASAPGIETLASRGIDLVGHRSRRITVELLTGSDLIVGMAREHVREAATSPVAAGGRDLWPRCFTLKELVRRGDTVGPRKDGEALADWLARVHAGRSTESLLGHSPDDDVADPIGQSAEVYARTADELSGLVDRLVELVWPESD